MLVHFPIGLWPAHFALHLFSGKLPAGMPVVAFWLLAAGCSLAWLAALCGAADLIAISNSPDRRGWRPALVHACINAGATAGFSALAVLEYSAYPAIQHGGAFLAGEAALLGLMFVGNYFGGAIVWTEAPSK